MDNEKKDNFFDDDMSLLPLDFPEDEEEDEEKEDDVESKITETSYDNSEKEVDSIKMATEDLPENKEENEEEEPEGDRPQDKDTKEEAVKEEVVVDKEEKMPPPAKKAKKDPEPIQFSSNFLPGQILQEGRVRADLSIEQVAQETKIKKSFIAALEQGDKENLPPKVYVAAYVKQLCRVYKIDASQVLNSMSDHPLNNGKKVSGEILSDIEKGKQVNFQEEVRVRKFFKIVAIVLLVLAVTITLVVKFGILSKDNPSDGGGEGPKLVEAGTIDEDQPQQTITSEDLEIFLVSQPFTMTEMDVPKNN